MSETRNETAALDRNENDYDYRSGEPRSGFLKTEMNRPGWLAGLTGLRLGIVMRSADKRIIHASIHFLVEARLTSNTVRRILDPPSFSLFFSQTLSAFSHASPSGYTVD